MTLHQCTPTEASYQPTRHERSWPRLSNKRQPRQTHSSSEIKRESPSEEKTGPASHQRALLRSSSKSTASRSPFPPPHEVKSRKLLHLGPKMPLFNWETPTGPQSGGIPPAPCDSARYTKQATVAQQRLSLLNYHGDTAQKKAGQDSHASTLNRVTVCWTEDLKKIQCPKVCRQNVQNAVD